MSRTQIQREISRDTLQARFNKAIIEHFTEEGDDLMVDAGDIVVASCAILVAYMKAVPEPNRERILEKVVQGLRRDILGAGNA